MFFPLKELSESENWLSTFSICIILLFEKRGTRKTAQKPTIAHNFRVTKVCGITRFDCIALGLKITPRKLR